MKSTPEIARVGSTNGSAVSAQYHATRNRGACGRDTYHPCAICGWSEHMAIHDEQNRHIAGYGHAYLLNEKAQPRPSA